jgi:hypothetical protein
MTKVAGVGDGNRGIDVNELEKMTPGPAGRRWLGFFSIGIVAVYGLLFLLFLNRSGPKDQDQFLVFHELQLWNTTLFGLAKQWSPVMCSGLSLAGEPQVPFMSLSMALSYVLGPFLGLRLATLLYFVAGWAGAYLYAGLWLKQFGQRALAASLFIGNGFFICRLGFGHIDFIPFLTLPLLLWALHQATTHQQEVGMAQSAVRIAVTTLLMGGLIAIAIDGSPVAIIHLMFWVGLYALIFAYTVRSLLPIAIFSCAGGLATVLDAGYLWPMLEAQAQFPRHTEDTFSSALSLLWFALLPVRGKVLPANGNGHELSVFIGPVIAYFMWSYRHWLAAALPRSMRVPLVVVCIVSIVLGMGSLKPLHIPTWLSPFDMLRPLPGFRSIGVTGRFWGFLALPLSLLGAAALWRFVSEHQHTKKLRVWLSCALLLQLGFQTETVLAQWVGTNPYRAVPVADQFSRGPEEIEFVATDEEQMQGEFITPTRGVINCYDMDDFIRADVNPGRQIVKEISGSGAAGAAILSATGKFASWNHLQIDVRAESLSVPPDSFVSTPSRVQLVLNQAFNPWWQAPNCNVSRGDHGNLVLDCPADVAKQGPIDLVFHNKVSARAALVSTTAWQLWFSLLGGALLGSLAVYTELSIRRRTIRLPR